MSGYCKDCNTWCLKITPIGTETLEEHIRDYCAYCLPPQYITKPIKYWICDSCNGRKYGGY